MIRAATKMASAAAGNARDVSSTEGLALLMESISRSLCLGEALPRELEAVRIAELPQVGALTIGEIASHSRTSLEFFNKTTMVGVLIFWPPKARNTLARTLPSGLFFAPPLRS